MKRIARDLCPPLLWRAAAAGAKKFSTKLRTVPPKDGQDLQLYWDEEMAKILESWGEGNAWNEIQLLLCNLKGTALDIACGTGKVIDILSSLPDLKVYGCDISDFLLDKAVARGLAREILTECDATKLPYANRQFDYSYSIGSLEHFTLDGINEFILEAARVTKLGSFHNVPTARSGKDEGWLKTYQSYHNCSTDWWRKKFERHFARVRVFESKWEDSISIGKWFVCFH